MKKKFPSELRLERSSGNWVVIATGRAKRPEMFKKEKREKIVVPKKNCPFCRITEEPILVYSGGKNKGRQFCKDWSTMVLANKYPAFVPATELDRKREDNLFERMNAVGFHEVVVTRDHDKSLALLSRKHVKEVIDSYTERFSHLINKEMINYVSVFHNHGPEAGASIYHPHSQIIALPLIDCDLKSALAKAERYKKKKECIYCKMNEWELRRRERIVYQNKRFIALCPYASKLAFQVIITPKKHLAFFDKITEEEKVDLADALKTVLFKLYKGLGDPPYNFYLHSAPIDGQDHSYYHWHWTILPKTSIWAGFELGVGIEISTIEPEKAAAFLRKQKVPK